MRAIILILLAMVSSEAIALETDNYIVWGKELKSSRSVINKFLADNINHSIQSNKDKSCKDITSTLARKFKSIGVSHNPVENYLVDILGTDSIYPATFKYVSESIYRDPFLPHIPSFGLSPNIQVDGIYLGTDKLSHFASTGYTYFLIYSTFLFKGEEEAEIAALTYGLKDEQSLHGYWASGVFSYADLEANYQGMKFYKNICTRYIKKLNGEWKLTEKPDIAEYVSAYWDETFNKSYFVSANWKKVRPVIQKEYCYQLKRPHYLKSKKSFSQKYLEGKGPRPQVLRECQDIKLQ